MLGENWNSYEKVIKNLNTLPGAGFNVLYHEGKMHTVTGESHTLILGDTGSGKSSTAVYPFVRNVLDNGEIVIFLNTKDDATADFAKIAEGNGYRVVYFNFQKLLCSDRINPLKKIYKKYKSASREENAEASSELIELSEALYPIRPDEKDPFWQDASRSMFMGAALYLFNEADESQINMASIYHIVTDGKERFGASNYLKEALGLLPEGTKAREALSTYINAPSDTSASLLSVFLRSVGKFIMDDGLEFMTSGDDIDIYNIDANEKIAVFITMSDSIELYNQVAGIVVSQLLSHYRSLANNYKGCRLPVRVNFVCEELGNIASSLPQLDKFVTEYRGFNIRLHLVLQSIHQLKTAYGDSKAMTIFDNTGLKIAFRLNDPETIDMLAARCGEKKIIVNNTVRTKPLLNPSVQMNREVGDALILLNTNGINAKFNAKLPFYSELYGNFSYEKDYHIKPQAERCVFNIKSHVKAKKEEAMSRVSKAHEMFETNEKNVRMRMPKPITILGKDFTSPFDKDIHDNDVADIWAGTDELIRRIDQRIKELEEQEKAEAEAKDKAEVKPSPQSELDDVFNFKMTFYEITVPPINTEEKLDKLKEIASKHAIACYEPENHFDDKLFDGNRTFTFLEKAEAIEFKEDLEKGGFVCKYSETEV